MSELISGDAGRICFLIKGEYRADSMYDFLDVVHYEGSSYVAKKETTGNQPADNNEFWQILASKGDSTSVSVTGVKGETEPEYRRGNVNITKENIGLSNVANERQYSESNPQKNVTGSSGSCTGNSATATKATKDASGNVITDTYAKKVIYNDESVSLGRKTGSSAGKGSFAFGLNVVASGQYALSTGNDTAAIGNVSKASGGRTTAYEDYCNSEGFSTSALNLYAHSEGGGSVAIASAGHAEGTQTIAGNGYILHVKSFDATTKKFVFTETYDNFSESFSKINAGIKIHIIDIRYISSAYLFTVKSVDRTANAITVEEIVPSSDFSPWLSVLSVANTRNATAHSEGKRTIANGENSHSEGEETKASGANSHAGGYYTIANGSSQTAIGRFNVKDSNTGFANPFIVGIGSAENARSNGFRVNSAGAAYGKTAFNSSGADYAEFIRPWADGNPYNEDRVGYFVTVKDGYLHKANASDYIVGITSGNPSVVGNSDEEYYWRWERDEFNRIVYEEVEEYVEKFDEEGNPVIEDGKPIMIPTGRMEKRMKQSAGYDGSQQQFYVERKDRPEWDYVGMVGVVPVRDDGTCVVGHFCRCGDGGIATFSETREFDTYMVIDRITDSVVSVILK